jgi:NitT/TauT family transport system substrate-binding protein
MTSDKEQPIMPHLLRLALSVLLIAGFLASAFSASAQTLQLRIGKQLGLSYLPLIVAEHDKLIEKHARQLGLEEPKIDWVQLGSAAALNDAILSGSCDYVAGASTVLTVLWDKTRKNMDVRGVVALGNFDYALNSANPAVHGVADFTDKDRIAVSGVKLSVHAILLQMAAAKAFGADQWDRLDHLTVSMSHSDGMVALMSGHSEITAHLTTPPFQDLELADKRIHRVFAASDVLGDGGATILLFAANRVRQDYPKLNQALIEAVREADQIINTDRHRAAEIYLAAEKPSLGLAQVEALLNDPGTRYTAAPRNIVQFAQFMARTGTIRNRPETWQELFFPDLDVAEGS